jgi:hypothetical protein
LDIKLAQLREETLNVHTPSRQQSSVPQSFGVHESIPTTKSLIEALPDIDLQCLISSVRTIPEYKITTSDIADITNAVIKQPLALNHNAQ